MKNNIYYDDDVCVVGMGCVLPGANNPQEFWSNILEGNCSIEKIPDRRWKSRLYFSADKKEKDKTYSNMAAFVEEKQLEKICKKLGLDSPRQNRLHAMTLEAATQAFDCLSKRTVNEVGKNTAVFLGCMETDEDFSMEKFYAQNKKTLQDYVIENDLKDKQRILKKIQSHFNGCAWNEEGMTASVLTSSVISFIKQKLSIRGEGALIDAACASSLAAIDVAMMSLKDRKADLVVTGGIESNLAPDTFVLFSKVGALSTEKCYPFDEKAQGLCQGEGAVVFVLQRLEDAVRDKNKIYGVLRSSGSSSDGRNSSLFSPSVEGQVLALERAYEGLDRDSVSYIECHGTGTKLGDGIELAAINKFFNGEKIPVGSVKSLVGHTKGAAGAAGLLKCLLQLQNKKISPSKYLEKFIGARGGCAYINKETVNLSGSQNFLRFGVSSFGFGNVNYHLVVDEFGQNSEITKTKKDIANNDIVVLGSDAVSSDEVDFNLIRSKFKIPPQSLAHADKAQLQALLAVSEVFKKAKIKIDTLDKKRIMVISASCLGLEAAGNLGKRVRHFEFIDALGFLDYASLDLMLKHKNKFPEITEDTGPGVLNNIIAGRICNTFDLNGANFNVDCDFNSFSAALNIATGKLNKKNDLVILIYCDEKLSGDRTEIEMGKVNCLILSTVGFAKKHNYPICEVIEKINYEDSK